MLGRRDNFNRMDDGSEVRASNCSWQKVACTTVTTLAVGGTLAGIGYGLYKLWELGSQEYTYPELSYDDASNAVVNGTVSFTSTPDVSCNLDPALNITANALWAKSIAAAGAGFTFVANIFANSTEMAQQRAAAILAQMQSQFPMKALGYGVYSTGEGSNDAFDPYAIYYNEMAPLAENNELFLSPCEEPLFFTADTAGIVEDPAALAAKHVQAQAQIAKDKNRHGFFSNNQQSKKENKTGLSVSNDEMADSAFGHNLRQRLRRQ